MRGPKPPGVRGPKGSKGPGMRAPKGPGVRGRKGPGVRGSMGRWASAAGFHSYCPIRGLDVGHKGSGIWAKH